VRPPSHVEELPAAALGGNPQSPYPVLLAYLQWCFEREEENSRRHSQTARIGVTTVIAFLAVGLFRFGIGSAGVEVIEENWRPWLVALLVVAIVVLLAAVRLLLGTRKGPDLGPDEGKEEERGGLGVFVPASAELIPTGEELSDLIEPASGSAEYYYYMALLHTGAATADLVARNVVRNKDVWTGKSLLVLGIFLLAALLTLYTVAPRENRLAVEIEKPAEVDGTGITNEREQENAGEARDAATE